VLITYRGIEYDIGRSLHARDLAEVLGVLREVVDVQDEGGVEAVAHVLWKRLLERGPGSLDAYQQAGGAR
jgi:hypothetical protein